MKKLTLGAIALAASTMIGSAASHADYIGYVFTGLNPNPGASAASNATLAQFTALGGAAAADATFTTNVINFFANDSTTTTVGTFFGNCVGAGCNDVLNGTYTFIQNTNGTLTQAPGGGAVATITHDDGVEVARNGSIVFSQPGPNPASSANVPWGAGAGALTLSYGECCQGPAELVANFQQVAAAVPEPASLALLGAALAGFGVMRRRRKTV